MNRSRITAAIVLAAATTAFVTIAGHAASAAQGPSADPAAGLATPTSSFVPGHLLVHFKHGTSAGAQAATLHGVGASDAGSIRDLGVQIVDVPAGAEQRVAAALLRTGKVAFAEPDGVVHATAVPNDSAITLDPGHIAIFGPQSVGKTTYITVLIHELDHRVGVDRHRGIGHRRHVQPSGYAGPACRGLRLHQQRQRPDGRQRPRY